MTATVAAVRAPRRWRSGGGGTVRVIGWATRLVGLLALASVVVPNGRQRLSVPGAPWLDIPRQASLTVSLIVLVAGVCLLCLAAGLGRCKRRSWLLAVLVIAALALLQPMLHYALVVGLAAAALCFALLVTRKHFYALPDPVVGKWPAVLAFVQMLGWGFLLNLILLSTHTRGLLDHPTPLHRVEQALLALGGVSGPLRFRAIWLDDMSSGIGLVFGIGAMLAGGYFVVRAAEPRPRLAQEDEDRLRVLLNRPDGADSLGYFALHRDKSAVFSPNGEAAITYRVLAGVALVSGNPLGDAEAWPGAIEAFLDECGRHAWVPAAVGCSRLGAAVWREYGFGSLQLGDEAVVDVTTFTVGGLESHACQQAMARMRGAGYRVRVRRASQIEAVERAKLAALADHWRGTDTYAMALSRLADAGDPRCVVVSAEQNDEVRGLQQFVPWAADGLVLDLMRHDQGASGDGLNELMTAELLAACPGLGVRRVSLNFAMSRASLDRNQRIGAGPLVGTWVKVLRLAARWWQTETRYRFNAAFRPGWVPRHLVFPSARDLARILLAATAAKGFGGRPPALLRVLRRR